MRFVVYGTGAIGGVIGARLHQSGHEVVAIARGAQLEAIRRRGLRVECPNGAVEIALPVVGHPSEISWRAGDVVLLATKSQDSAGALDALAACAPRECAVVCAQNGVANERLALERFSRVHGVAVMCPALHLEPGGVQVYADPIAGILDVGRWPAGADDTTYAVAAAFARSTFASVARLDIARWKYRKLITNLSNAVQALCGTGGAELVRRAQAEGETCLRAADIDVASQEEDHARRSGILRVQTIGGRQRPGGSTWQSLARAGGTIETDHLNGEIVRIGRLHGVPTPVNSLLQRLADEVARERRPPGQLAEEALLRMLD